MSHGQAQRDVLYFGYGSNLDLDELDGFCREQGLPLGLFEPIGLAALPDRELAFSRRSSPKRWNGGVLDVRSRRGQLARGMLFRVRDEAGWEALDRKEGVRAGAYERLETVALRSDGSTAPVRTYTVRTPEAFVEPSARYVDVVRRARARWGLDTDELERAATNEPRRGGSVFVYGTLLRGECREACVRTPALRSVSAAECTGELVDLGEYPGLRVGTERRVVGELLTFDALEAVLEELDAIEEFHGFEALGAEHLFERRYVTVRAGGEERPAWVYVVSAARSGPVIESGCWRTHREAASSTP